MLCYIMKASLALIIKMSAIAGNSRIVVLEYQASGPIII